MTENDLYVWETSARPAEIRRCAQGLRTITGVLLGHGDDVGAVLNEVALSFSEVISTAIAAQIGTNVAALESSVEGTEYGFGVSTAWAEDVEAFITARADLMARWEAAVANDFGVPATTGLPNADEEMAEAMYFDRDQDVAHARGLAMTAYQNEGNQLYEWFQVQVGEKGRLFREGPTAANLALLAPYLGGGATTLWPEIAPPLIVGAEDGAVDGATVIDTLDGAASPEDFVDAMTTVAIITRRAEYGYELTEGELAYLESFYATTGDRILDVPAYMGFDTRPTSDPGVYVPSIPFAGDPGMASTLTAAAANGLLVLSRPTSRTTDDDHDGYERLPQWVKDTFDLSKDDFAPFGSPADDAFFALLPAADFLGYSTVEAGSDFSREVALSVDWMISYVDYRYDDTGDETLAELRTAVARSAPALLDVAARNDEVSLGLLTGSGMPDDYSPAEYFTNLYAFDWEFDDGAAAASLTDFITAYAGSSDPGQQAMANEAMGSLFGILTDPDAFATLMDEVGNSGDAANSSLGQVNPEISAGMGQIMGDYLADFGLPQGTAGAFGDPTMEARARFATLVMTNPDAGVELADAIYAYNAESLSQVDDTVSAAQLADPAGRLLGLLDAGAVNLVMDEVGDRIEQAEDEAAGGETQSDIFQSVISSVVGEVPYAGGILADLMNGFLDSGNVDDIELPDLLDAVAADPARRYDVLAAVAENLRMTDRLNDDLDPALLDESGAIRDFADLPDPGDPANPGNLTSDGARAALELAIEEALGLSAGDLLEELDRGYNEVAGLFPTSPEAYENRYER